MNITFILNVTVHTRVPSNGILPMLRIPNRQNLLPELYRTEFSVQKIPTCEQLLLNLHAPGSQVYHHKCKLWQAHLAKMDGKPHPFFVTVLAYMLSNLFPRMWFYFAYIVIFAPLITSVSFVFVGSIFTLICLYCLLPFSSSISPCLFASATIDALSLIEVAVPVFKS